jgi:hypothetical protein
MIKIPPHDLRAGDVVDYHGELHTVAHIDQEVGWAWPVAFDDAGWAIAVGGDLLCVNRAA